MTALDKTADLPLFACERERRVRLNEGLARKLANDLRRQFPQSIGAMDPDDVLAECMYGLYVAARDFEAERGNRISTLATTIIKRRLWGKGQQWTRRPATPLSTLDGYQPPDRHCQLEPDEPGYDLMRKAEREELGKVYGRKGGKMVARVGGLPCSSAVVPPSLQWHRARVAALGKLIGKPPARRKAKAKPDVLKLTRGRQVPPWAVSENRKRRRPVLLAFREKKCKRAA